MAFGMGYLHQSIWQRFWEYPDCFGNSRVDPELRWSNLCLPLPYSYPNSMAALLGERTEWILVGQKNKKSVSCHKKIRFWAGKNRLNN